MRHRFVFRRGVAYLAFAVAVLALAQHVPTYAQTIKLTPASGTASTASITITGNGLHFGNRSHQGNVTFEGVEAKVTGWSDNAIQVAPVDAQAKMPVHLTVVVYDDRKKPIGQAGAFFETLPPLNPASGPAGTTVTINGKGFGAGIPGTVTIAGVKVGLAAGTSWSDSALTVVMPDAGARLTVGLNVVVTSNGGNHQTIGAFEETPIAPSALSSTSGQAGAGVAMNDTSLGSHGAMSGMTVDTLNAGLVRKATWSDNAVKVVALDAGAQTSVNPRVEVADGSGKTHDIGELEQDTPPPQKTAVVVPNFVVPNDKVNISGIETDLSKDKNVQVTFNGVKGTKPTPTSDSVTVTVPELKSEDYDKPVDVAVIDGNSSTVAQSRILASPELWGDSDETPLDIKFIGGYEQGYLSSQSSSNDGFLAVYGRKLFGPGDLPKIGPYFAIRLLTAPQASNTDNVSSLLTNPTGAVTATSLQGVGSAVDLSLGLEYQLKSLSKGRTTLSLIGGGGFVTPLQANSVTATFKMPAFGTVECTALQGRLAPVLSGAAYTNIVANTAPGSSACFSNKGSSASKPTAITLLQYAAPDTRNFFPKYSIGLRMINRWPGVSGGPSLCNPDNKCERGYVDFTLGQNTSITGGSLKHVVFTTDSTYPLPVTSLNYLYLFGTFSKRFHRLPASLPPLILEPGTAPSPSTPSLSNLVVPMTQPDKDFYRFGAGVDITKIFKALTNQTK